MQFNIPKNTRYLRWTKHVIKKMMFYGLSATKVKNVLSRYDRMEPGIAPDTTAVMKKTGSRKNPSEMWVMYQDKIAVQDGIEGTRRIIITAWRYPGTSKPREQIPVPEGLLEELKSEDEIEI